MYGEDSEDSDFDEYRHFQVNVVILEGRHLAAANSDSKVVVTVGNRRKTLRSKTAKTDAPYFNELCIFNFYLPLGVLLDEILKIKIYGVTKLRRNRLIGSFSVELATIWVQPNHQFYHKWAALTDPKNPAAGVRGYLKCDVGLLARGTKSRAIDRDPADKIEGHLLVPYGEVDDRRRAKFVFSVFRADNFSSYFSRQPLFSLYAYVRITYAGVSGKTSVASNTFVPFWNEELAFVDMIPALCRYVHVEICDAFKATSKGVLASANLDLRKLSHESENGFLPTYGPSFLYLYQNLGKFERQNKSGLVNSSLTYMCRLLIALRTEVVDYAEDVLAKKANMLAVKPKSIPSLDEAKYFEYNEFIFFAVVLDVLIFDASIVTSKVGVRVNIGPDKPVQTEATLKPPVEVKPALKKKSDASEDNEDDKNSVKSKKTVTFDNEERSEVLDVEVSGEGDPGVSHPDEKLEAKKPSDGRRSKLGGWKPLKRLEHWQAPRISGNKPPDSSLSNKPNKWKLRNSAREWKPLKEMQNWPTEWRRKRKSGATTGPEANAAPSPSRKRTRHPPRGPIKRLQNSFLQWKRVRRKKVDSAVEKEESSKESGPSAANMVGSSDSTYTASESVDPPRAKVDGKIIKSHRSGEISNHNRGGKKAKLYFAEYFALSESPKNLRIWPGEGRRKWRNPQSSEGKPSYANDEDEEARRGRNLGEWIRDSVRGPKPKRISPRVRDRRKRLREIAARTGRLSGSRFTTDLGEKYRRVKRKLGRRDTLEEEEDHGAVLDGKYGGIGRKRSLKAWKRAKILGEWPTTWRLRKRKESSHTPPASPSTDENRRHIRLRPARWGKASRRSSSDTVDVTSSSSGAQGKRRKMAEWRRKFGERVARDSGISRLAGRRIFGREGKMESGPRSERKRNSERLESSSSEMSRTSDQAEENEFSAIKETATSPGDWKPFKSLRKWPTEWRKFRGDQETSPAARRRGSDRLGKTPPEEPPLVRWDLKNYGLISNEESTPSARSEPTEPPSTRETFVSEHSNQYPMSDENFFVHNPLGRSVSNETVWSQTNLWSKEQTENEVTLSPDSSAGNGEKDDKTAKKEESGEGKRSSSEEIGGIIYTDFEPEDGKLSVKLKQDKRAQPLPVRGYYSDDSSSSTLDESDTSSESGEGRVPRRKKKHGPSSEDSSESETSSDSEGRTNVGREKGDRESGESTSWPSSENATDSDSEENEESAIEKRATETDCRDCEEARFREALKSARGKKRYWQARNKRKRISRLFSPENTTERNVQVYFALKKELARGNDENLWPGGETNIIANYAKVTTTRKSHSKDKIGATGRKKWMFWRRKRKKSIAAEKAENVSFSPEEFEVEEDETKEEKKWRGKGDDARESKDERSSSSRERDPANGLDVSQEVDAERQKGNLPDGKAEKGKVAEGAGSSSDEEAVMDSVENWEAETGRNGEIGEESNEKYKVENGAEEEGSEGAVLGGVDEPELDEELKKEEGERKGTRAKKRKRRFWSRKKREPEERKELKFAETEGARSEESETEEIRRELGRVRIYNGCNAIGPQPVAVRDHYGYTTFSGRYPCLHVNGEWPNALRRMYRSNVVQKSVANFKTGIEEVENELASEKKMEASEKLKKIFRDLSESCREILSLTATIVPEDTNLYRERKRCYHREIREIIAKTETASKKNILVAEDELKRAYTYLSTLQRYAHDPEDSFPDTEIWLVKDGKTVAQHRMRTEKIVFSPNAKERGIRSGKIQSVIVRSREGQEVAKLEMFMWFGLGNHFVECRNMLPPGFEHEPHKCRGTNVQNVPLLLSYSEAHHFTCRVHLFQARILVAADANGLADPFVRVIVLGNFKDSQIQKETLNPTWDETLVFSNLTLYGPADYIKENSTTITVEVIDYDYLSRNELIGRTLLKPVVRLHHEDRDPPKLRWEDIRKEGNETGKILLAAELVQVAEQEPEDPESRGKTLPVPEGIRPRSVGHRLEVLFWGVRELKKKSPGSTRVYVTVECGGKHLSSPLLKNTRKGLNFPGEVQTLDLELPEEHEYKPPLIVKLFQTNPLVPGYETYAGNCIIPSVKAFFCTAVDDQERKRKELAFMELLAESTRAKKAEEDEAAAREKTEKRKQKWKRAKAKVADVLETVAAVFVKCYKRIACKIRRSCVSTDPGHLQNYEDEDETLDWWVKYYASKEHKRDGPEAETLIIYEEELELQPEFGGFSDFIYTFDLMTGKAKRGAEDQVLVGKVKAAVKLYRWPLEEGSHRTLCGVDIKKGVLKQLPSNAAIKYVVRIYVISCKNLTPKDLNGKSDPYLVLQVGNQRINDEKNYVPKQVNPVFGRCFEFRGIFPKEHLLRIKVMDHDVLTKDDLIGETFIDLESRYYTRHHASCGLPKVYSRTGYTAWRDAFRPTEILKTVCKRSNLEGPVYTNEGVRVGEYEFRGTAANEKHKDEIHALAALKKWHEIPLHGFHLVPEHVETRALYHPSFPGVEQGKIEMWVDIFPADFRYVPPIVDVEPRKPVSMELRAIVWNVEGVILDDTTLFFNEKMSDIYVQGWLNAVEEDKQATDVHYRSMNGEGNFNWRFVFPFKYISTERRLVVYKKQNVFDVEPEEMKFPCRLELQVWDNDFFSDDFLGSLNLELSSMPRGAKISTRCKLSMFEETAPKINLFKIRRTRGWWPFRRLTDPESSEYSLTGKIDLELEVVTEKEASENPVGRGREEPKALPGPKRPESSFIWFLNPLKTCRYIICRKYGKYLIMITAIAMVVAFVLLGIYAFPGYAVKRMVGA